MPNFSDITVVAIHGNNGIEKMLPALDRTVAGLPGCRTLLITDRPTEQNVSPAEDPEPLAGL